MYIFTYTYTGNSTSFKKEVINLSENREGHIGAFEEKKGKGEIL